MLRIVRDVQSMQCNTEPSNSSCISLSRERKPNGSLCLDRLSCDEEMLFICDSELTTDRRQRISSDLSSCRTVPGLPENASSDAGNSTAYDHRLAPLIGLLAPMAFDLFGNLLGGNSSYRVLYDRFGCARSAFRRASTDPSSNHHQ